MEDFVFAEKFLAASVASGAITNTFELEIFRDNERRAKSLITNPNGGRRKLAVVMAFVRFHCFVDGSDNNEASDSKTKNLCIGTTTKHRVTRKIDMPTTIR